MEWYLTPDGKGLGWGPGGGGGVRALGLGVAWAQGRWIHGALGGGWAPERRVRWDGYSFVRLFVNSDGRKFSPCSIGHCPFRFCCRKVGEEKTREAGVET